jgi:predicted DNA-binding transcriptional regulator AlpA
MIRFLSRAEVAELLGVSLSTAKQYVDFPEPDAKIGRNNGWTRETIEQWVTAREQSGRPVGRGRA